MTDKVSEFNVTDKKSFIEFLNLLHQDLIENPETWENNNLSSFLEAFIIYTEDVEHYYENMNVNIDPNKASWRMFADIFRGAKVYE